MYHLGTTSYIIPDHILPNVRYLAGKVQDIELVLFEVDNGPNNLPSAEDVAELKRLAALYNLTYTVHLPLDLKLAADGSDQDVSLLKARKVIECTRPLDPWAYVLHLDGRAERHSSDPAVLQRWQDQAVKALEIVAGWAGGPEKLAVENLDHYPPTFNDPVIERIPVSRCVDIGHLWRDNQPVMTYLQRWLPRTRVIHAHGVSHTDAQHRDHLSLTHAPTNELATIIQYLQDHYEGVLTLEVFGETDFLSSIETLHNTLPSAALRESHATRSTLTLLLGGARSGKSRHAKVLATSLSENVLYVTTATPGDDEMDTRIANQQAQHPASWRTLEAPTAIGSALATIQPPPQVILVDCLTLLVSNILLGLPENASEAEVSQAVNHELDGLFAAMQTSQAHWIIVSNEVGMGLVPPYPLGRVYRDALGGANQRMAQAAHEVLLLVAGLPVKIKALPPLA
jgi:adenosyl cobinamide kinase/adenosyl cobinamide phosphate guanylyltransferase/sugar phosphate isomerase/epimerase